ncbi:hypothetical protein CH54_1402 [Yersinia rochesterensis]|uniref:DUF2833 domain-containing protein n=1 Tax=Yersinia rochesterensis TaxID=1604335 RepID=A0ABM5SMB0_9GAMM|nr:hypothetical protein [Yersinia rochesterensis]AJI85334.1 hypothetical protein AW19_262 [Yersinia frederiksenii Y225]AJJ35564.1 hypothetical protein CH54_1402 [Yersinia rochesterensis]
MRHVQIVPATPEHAAALLPRVRQADADEFYAAALMSPDEVIRRSMSASTICFAGLVDGEVIALFGVVPASILTGFGVPWLVATESMERYQVTFLRHCRPVVRHMLSVYPRLENFIDARNYTAKIWLRWLGFTIDDPIPYGALKLPFHHFELRANHV